MASGSGAPKLSYRPHKPASKATKEHGCCLAGLFHVRDFAYDLSLIPWFGCVASRIIFGTWVDEKVHGRRVFKGPKARSSEKAPGELPDPPEDIKTEPASELKGDWPSMLRDGQVWAGLIMSTSYSHKYKGSKVPLGSTAPVKLPALTKEQEATWQLKLLDLAGNKEGVALIWLGDPKYDGKTIYVAMSMMRDLRQVRRIMWSTPDLGTGDSGNMGWEKLPVGTYVRWKMDKLWDTYGLGKKLDAVVDEYKGYRIVFAGISHGASLAQAAALRLKFDRPDADVRCVVWNAYLWTDKAGRDLAKETLGDKMLSLVLTHRLPWDGTRIWDAVTSSPHVFEAMHDVWLLDTDTGSLSSTGNHPNFPGKNFYELWHFRKMWRLHYASIAITATRIAMKKSLRGVQ